MVSNQLDSFRLQALVFDLDGVLVDSRALMQHAYTAACRVHRLRSAPPAPYFVQQCGRPLDEIVRDLGLPPSVAMTFRRISRVGLHMVRLVEGVRELLTAARRRCGRTGLVTGKDRRRTASMLEHFGLADAFDVMVCGDDPHPGKPDPAGLLAVLEEIAVAPHAAAFLGDSPVDVTCAVRAGVTPLGASWGFFSAHALCAAGAEWTFGHPCEVERWIADNAHDAAAAHYVQGRRD